MKSFILLIALSTPLFARLGETMEQCVERYGKPVNIDNKKTNFLKSEMTISLEFYKNKAIYISYKRKNQNLTEAEVQTLIQSNLPNIDLEKEILKSIIVYRTSTEDYTALVKKDMTLLVIMDNKSQVSADKEESEKQKSDAKKTLNGL